MNSSVLRTHIFLFSLLFSSLVSAAPITYSLADDSNVNILDSLSLTESGVTVDIWGTAMTSSGEETQDLHQNGYGIGVYVGSPDGRQVDGLGPDETLYFGFDSSVQLLSATFTRVGTNDEFSLTADDILVIADDIPGGVSGTDTDSGVYDFSADNIWGSTFGFSITDAYDDYKLASLTIDTGAIDATVPEPETVAMMFLGLSLIQLQRRRSKQSV